MMLGDIIVSNAVIAIPAVAALILVFQADYRRAAQINTNASGIIFIFSLILLIKGKETNDYLFVDDLNIVFIVLSSSWHC